jgi:hypothetical protein
MQGDGVYVDHWGTSLSERVTIDRLTVRDNGRMGVAVVGGRDVTVRDMTAHNMAFHVLDCEPDNYTPGSTIQGCHDLTFDGGVSTGWVGRFPSGLQDAAFAYIGTPHNVPVTGCDYGPAGNECFIDGVTIRDWRVEDGRNGMRVAIGPSNYRARDILIEGNWSDVTLSGFPAVSCVRSDAVTIRNNHQPRTGAFVSASDCPGLVQTGNTP